MDARLFIRSLIFGVIIAALARSSEARKEYPRQQQRVRRQLDPSRFYAQNFTVGLHSKALDYGPWGPWTESSSCSRSCGGGIAYQERICMNLRADGVHSCVGSARRYYSCNIQDCPSGSKDFRLEQCAKFNTIPYEEKYYSWYPYEKAQNPCELNCMPRGERFYTRMARKVIDGTRCHNDGSLDACVDGLCMPVGCDMVLGSGTKEDKCRVCGGDGSSCRLIQGISDSNDFHVGYNDLLLIPAGATFIHIKEVRATNNYLAVRNLAGKYYLNGNWRIEFPREVKFAGTQFVYERKPQGYLAPESLRARGPTAEPIFIVLLYQEKNLGISYEYSIPEGVNTAKPDTYSWTFGDFEECSQTCGGGTQVRLVQCIRSSDREVLSDDLCDPLLKPVTNGTCNSQPCPARWHIGEWTNCSKPCAIGTQYRIVYCQQLTEKGSSILLNDNMCHDPKPLFMRTCNEDIECPAWHKEPWSECDRSCGLGNQTREVTCRNREHGEVLEDFQCSSSAKPAEFQECSVGPCEGVEWIVSDWSGCEGLCSPQMESREAYCSNENGTIFSDEACDPKRIPELTRPCPESAICEPMWHTSQWTKCSAKCGTGVQTRVVFCGVWEDNVVMKVDESKCNLDTKLSEVQNCSHAPCKGVWFQSPWNRCSVPCGGGERIRKILCFHNNRVVPNSHCDPSSRPFEKEMCNMSPCDGDEVMVVGGCKDSKYGCCPDGITAAGLNFEGCPKVTATEKYSCDESEFGCCADGITLALGPFKQGCPSISLCNGTKYGCCPDETTAAQGPENEGCPEPRQCDLSLFGCCPDGISEAEGEDFDGCEMNCTLSEFGCCLDGVTAASGENFTGCEISTTSFTDADFSTIEASGEPCTETEFGCCPDGVSIAYSPSMEGCPETYIPTEESGLIYKCNNSTYGCCPDNITIAKGPDGEGCDEVEGSGEEFDCLFTLYGCCFDNETASKGPNGEGCPETENCVNSTFGCCPDNITIATGPEGEGCEKKIIDCGNTTFGCCPDNITIATGPEGEGCEEKIIDCENTTFGCCPDNMTIAMGPEGEGCEERIIDCENTTFGCCPDNITIATGPEGEGCEEKITDCENTTFGCCPDNMTIATGPEGEGCEERIIDCENTTFGCCPDNMTIATGPEGEGCEERIIDCENTTFGCCPDNMTVATGPEGQGCEKFAQTDCSSTTFGCCPDNITFASGPNNDGCVDGTITSCFNSTFGCCPDNLTFAEGHDNQGCEKIGLTACINTTFGCCPDNLTTAEGPLYEGCNITNCSNTEFGCCPDAISPASGPDNEGCKDQVPDTTTPETSSTEDLAECVNTVFGCCPDMKTIARGPNLQGCCFGMKFGCCPDNITAALGPNFLGCGCQTYPYGCCPDGITFAQGYGYIGCRCEHYRYGCCQDKYTPAAGPNFDGCYCNRMAFGCCPDGITPATGRDNEGCGCHTTRFGCCPDGHTAAQSSDLRDCPCDAQTYGCCPDGRTPAQGPRYESCSCETMEFGCCSDGVTPAKGPNFNGCPDAKEPEVTTHGAVCHLPKDPGPCRNYTVKWFFDLVYGGCSRFWYGGCEGNGNVFNTQDQCEKVCVAPEGAGVCLLPKVVGPCEGKFPSWFYDAATGTCSKFIYSGCLGNNNRFASKEICEKSCASQKSLDVCEQPRVTGPCKDTFPRWYYDQQEKQCKQFVYGGCDGNQNNFETKKECRRRCSTLTNKEICILPKAEGHCLDNFPRWYYDYVDKRCKEFTYTGCQGNKNKFISKEKCEKICNSTHVQVSVDVCSLPKEEGPCKETLLRWYYSSSSGRCEQFYYGGCEGNVNRFETRSSCEHACLPVTEKDICHQPQEMGNCYDFRERWFYDYEAGQCRRFYFSGCGGNDNNFGSFPECERRCGKSVTTQLGEDEFRIEFCGLPADPGPCSKKEQLWFYDVADGVCKEFQYGGCHGNGNRFRARKDCERMCGASQDICNLPVVKGSCSNSFVQWYYDHSADECYEFLFTGCHGNANRFNSRENCQNQCKKQIITTVEVPKDDVCTLPEEPGPCQGYYHMWFYDSSDHSCKSFIYGGCDGNENRFETRKACEHKCLKVIREFTTPQPEVTHGSNEDVCRLPMEAGRCNEEHTRWYYDVKTESCLRFVYGGCGGNKNRFKTPDICIRFCTGIQAAVSLDEETPYVPPPVSTTTTTTTTTPPSPVCPPSNCEQLVCPYGFDKSYDDQGCTKCQCLNPCKGHICEEGSRCVIEIFRTAEGEPSIRPICRLVNKPGECLTNVQPLLAGSNSDCVDRCRNDADCSGDDKCCHNGCAYVCTKPVEIEESTTPAIAEAPVKILPSPSIVITQLGQPTILYCNAVGFPRPVVTWWRGYTMLPLTSSRYQQATDYSLMIRSVVYEDLGVYECQAYNGGPVAIWKVRVILESDDKSALPTYDDLNASRGNRIDNQDHTSNSRTDNWIHYGNDELSSPTENIFAATTTSIDDEDNQSLNVPLSTSVTLITNNPQVESAVQIDCEAQGPSPGTIVTWLFQGIEIQHHDQRVQILANHTLVINAAKVSDSGEYTCTAVHNDNVASSSVTITVTDPDCVDNPSFANCDLIVKAQYCNNRYYGKYCCASCTKAGQKLPSK